MLAAARSGDIETYAKNDIPFHRLIVEAAQNTFLFRLTAFLIFPDICSACAAVAPLFTMALRWNSPTAAVCERLRESRESRIVGRSCQTKLLLFWSSFAKAARRG